MSQSNLIVHEILSEIRKQLDEAVTIAKAAETCAANGHIDRAVEMSFAIEDLLHYTNSLFQAEAAIARMRKKNGESLETCG